MLYNTRSEKLLALPVFPQKILFVRLFSINYLLVGLWRHIRRIIPGIHRSRRSLLHRLCLPVHLGLVLIHRRTLSLHRLIIITVGWGMWMGSTMVRYGMLRHVNRGWRQVRRWRIGRVVHRMDVVRDRRWWRMGWGMVGISHRWWGPRALRRWSRLGAALRRWWRAAHQFAWILILSFRGRYVFVVGFLLVGTHNGRKDSFFVAIFQFQTGLVLRLVFDFARYLVGFRLRLPKNYKK